MERVSSSTSLATSGAQLKLKRAHGRKVSSFAGGDAWLGGAFRDRSVFFKEHREKARASSSSTSLSSSFEPLGSSKEIELHSLVSSSSSTSTSSSSAIMAGTDELRINVPPAWLRLVDESHYDLERIKSKMKELDGMHKKHLLPGFDDRDAEEVAIQLLTGEITQLMQKCQQRVVKLGNIKKGISDEQLRLKQNIRLSLAGELQELSSVFRQSQKSYLQKLEARRDRSRGGALHSGDRDMEGVDLYGGMTAQDEEMMADTGFSGSQIKQIAVLEEDVDQRSRDIVSVQESIVQLAELFKDLAVLLVEQGTILDRIDYNIEHTWENIDKSVAELGQAEKYQKKTGYKLCMLLLLFIIAGLIIAVGLKVIL